MYKTLLILEKVPLLSRFIFVQFIIINLRKGERPQEAESAWKKTARVSLKLFINVNERCNTIDAPWRMSGTVCIHMNNIQSQYQKNKPHNDVVDLQSDILQPPHKHLLL